MTHTPETGAINRLNILAPVLRTIYVWNENVWRQKIDIDDIFAKVADMVIAGIVAKGKLRRNVYRK